MNKTKDTKHDEKRKALPRLPSSRMINEEDSDSMELLYQLNSNDSKLSLIVDAARFALDNKESFLEFRSKTKMQKK